LANSSLFCHLRSTLVLVPHPNFVPCVLEISKLTLDLFAVFLANGSTGRRIETDFSKSFRVPWEFVLI